AAEVSLLWLATGEGPKSNGPVDDHHGPMMEAARERLRIIDEAIDRIRVSGDRELSGAALEDIRFYAFINNLDKKQIRDLASKWNLGRKDPRRVDLGLLASAVRTVEKLTEDNGAKLAAEKKAGVIAMLYERAVWADGKAAGAVDVDYAEKLILLAR
ncbi:MAG: hypothetical protein OEV92_11425, partial [Nitrospinota bacterium]|nr:hypothetical protein [Nitrospinota bacterium]